MYQMNGKTWNIVFVEHYSNMLQRSDGSCTVGMCDNSAQTIYIADNLQGKFQRKVLMHVAAHSAMFSYGLEIQVEQKKMV